MGPVFFTQIVLSVGLTVALYFSLRRVELAYQLPNMFWGYALLVAALTTELFAPFVWTEALTVISHVLFAIVALLSIWVILRLKQIVESQDDAA